MKHRLDVQVHARLASAVFILLLLVGCGSTEPIPTPTAVPPTATAEPTPEPRDDGVVSRVRRAPGAVLDTIGDGAGWVWDKVSSGGEKLWDVIRSSGTFLWDRVTGLPGDAWDLIKRFVRWVGGTRVGEGTRIVIDGLDELFSKNPLDRLIDFLQGILIQLAIIAALLLAIVFLLFGIRRWRLWTTAASGTWRRAERRMYEVEKRDRTEYSTADYDDDPPPYR